MSNYIVDLEAAVRSYACSRHLTHICTILSDNKSHRHASISELDKGVEGISEKIKEVFDLRIIHLINQSDPQYKDRSQQEIVQLFKKQTASTPLIQRRLYSDMHVQLSGLNNNVVAIEIQDWLQQELRSIAE